MHIIGHFTQVKLVIQISIRKRSVIETAILLLQRTVMYSMLTTSAGTALYMNS